MGGSYNTYCGAQDDFMGGAEIRVSDPVVAFRETVIGTSDHIVMSKSPNKHNRIYLQVPLCLAYPACCITQCLPAQVVLVGTCEC